jgi:hypothetical protein
MDVTRSRCVNDGTIAGFAIGSGMLMMTYDGTLPFIGGACTVLGVIFYALCHVRLSLFKKNGVIPQDG